MRSTLPRLVFAGTLLTYCAIALAISNRSYQLDELVTYSWLTGNWLETFSQTWRYSPSGVLFIPFLQFLTQFNAEEWFLRLPSLLFMLLSVLVVFMSLRAVDRAAAYWAGAFMLLSEGSLIAATNVRPYAIGSFLVCLAYRLWISAERDPRLWEVAVESVSAALVPFFHPLFAPAIVPVLCLRSAWCWKRRRWSWLILLVLIYGTAAATGCLMVRNVLALASFVPEFDPLRPALIPWISGVNTLWAPLICLALYILFRNFSLAETGLVTALPKTQLTILRIALLWWAIPPIALCAGQAVSHSQLMAERYQVQYLPAICVFMAITFGSIKFVALRNGLLLLCLALSLAGAHLWVKYQTAYDWRGAVQTINRLAGGEPKIKLLMNTYNIESLSRDYFRRPEFKNVLAAPLRYYPSPASEVAVLPAMLVAPYLDWEEVLRFTDCAAVATVPVALLVDNKEPASVNRFITRLEMHLAGCGKRRVASQRFGNCRVAYWN